MLRVQEAPGSNPRADQINIINLRLPRAIWMVWNSPAWSDSLSASPSWTGGVSASPVWSGNVYASSIKTGRSPSLPYNQSASMHLPYDHSGVCNSPARTDRVYPTTLWLPSNSVPLWKSSLYARIAYNPNPSILYAQFKQPLPYIMSGSDKLVNLSRNLSPIILTIWAIEKKVVISVKWVLTL